MEKLFDPMNFQPEILHFGRRNSILIPIERKAGETVAEFKTNVMRILDKARIPYTPHAYSAGDGAIDAVSVAAKLGLPPDRVFKTLVAKGPAGVCVFILPAAGELDLKKAARAAGQKSVALVRVDEINKYTGYVRGGCSPVGMKKAYPTFLDESAAGHVTILVSAGRIGSQVELAPDSLLAACGGSYAPLAAEFL